MQIELSSVSLHVVDQGVSSGPPLLLLHGATETFAGGWRHQIAPLAARFRLIGPDLRGHGKSSNPAGRLDLRRMADDLAELLAHLGSGPVHVAGYSGGASVALYLALRHPERLRSLVLVSSNFERDPRRTGTMSFWNPERIQRENPAWWATMVREHEEPARLLRWWAEEDRVRPDLSPAALAGITQPVLVVAGDRDPIITLDQTLLLFDCLPDSRLAILPATGHAVPVLRPARLAHLLLDFVNEAALTGPVHPAGSTP